MSGKIVLTEGKFTIAAAINFSVGQDHISVAGQGPSTILTCTTAINIFSVNGTNADKLDRVRFESLHFDGPTDGTTCRAIFADFADVLEIKDCYFRTFDGASTAVILLRDCFRARVMNNFFGFGTRGVELLQNDNTNRPSGSENSSICDNTFVSMAEDSIRLDESDSTTITGNTFKTCGTTSGAVINAITSVINTTISANGFESSLATAINGPFQETAITGNSMEALGTTSLATIDLDNGANVVSGNVFARNLGTGIEINGSNNLIVGNRIQSPGFEDLSALNDGIIVKGSRDNNTIIGNLVSSSSGKFMRYGIRVDASTCDNTVIIGNNVIANGGTVTTLISDVGTNTDLRNNIPSTLDGLIADPGDGNAIPVTRTGHVPLVSAGAETRTIADADGAGFTMDLYFKTDGGACVVTAASPINQTGNNTLTFADVGDHIRLVSIEDGADFEWREAANDGVALSTV